MKYSLTPRSFFLAGLLMIAAITTVFSNGALSGYGEKTDHLLFAAGGVEKQPIVRNETELTQRVLGARVARAINLWEATGLTKDKLAVLHNLKFNISDLPEIYLGLAGKDYIELGKNAGGNNNSWYVGTDNDNNLFSKMVSPTRSYTNEEEEPAGRVDLLTAILHEMGHKLGLEDTYDPKDRDRKSVV